MEIPDRSSLLLPTYDTSSLGGEIELFRAQASDNQPPLLLYSASTIGQFPAIKSPSPGSNASALSRIEIGNGKTLDDKIISFIANRSTDALTGQ